MIRIVVLGPDTLLSHGLFNFLQQTGELQVQALTYANAGDPALLRSIAQAQPEVIMLNANGPKEHLQLVAALFSMPQFMHLRVFGVKPDDNGLTVYSKADMVIDKAEQLLELIREGL